jgi:hypothetical protein
VTHIVPNGDGQLETLCGLALSHHTPTYVIPAPMVTDEPGGAAVGHDPRCPRCWAIWRTWKEQEEEWDAAEE